MSLRIGALFAGYGGLDMAVMDTLDAELAWYAEFDKAPAKVMAHHHPDVPNLWDVTTVDWAAVEPVDIITGGSPCQDLSHAGKRKGMKAGTRSGLWASMCDAIDIIRPRLVVWENVRGALSAEADSDLEPCPGCVGGADDGPVLRALGRVLGDLAELGYDARWYGLRAADVGGAHGRFRIFVIAAPADAGSLCGREGSSDGSEPRAVAAGGEAGRAGRHRVLGADDAGLSLLPTPTARNAPDCDAERERNTPSLEAAVALALLPTPRATDGTKGGPNQRGSSGDLMLPSAVHLLPTPTAADSKASGGSSPSDVTLTDAVVRTDLGLRENPRHMNGLLRLMGEGQSLLPTPRATRGGSGTETLYGLGGQRSDDERAQGVVLLPTPSVADVEGGRKHRSGDRADELLLNGIAAAQDWRQHATAIRRAEHATGRTAPAPTEPGAKGKPRLAPAFVEWLMMLPAGHVTDPAIGLTRNEQLKALGNGVVPPQAAAALRAYIHDEREAVA